MTQSFEHARRAAIPVIVLVGTLALSGCNEEGYYGSTTEVNDKLGGTAVAECLAPTRYGLEKADVVKLQNQGKFNSKSDINEVLEVTPASGKGKTLRIEMISNTLERPSDLTFSSLTDVDILYGLKKLDCDPANLPNIDYDIEKNAEKLAGTVNGKPSFVDEYVSK